MAVLFRGSGLVWIPAKHRSVRFVDGVYSTDDADEIAVLSKKYETISDIPAKVITDIIPVEVSDFIEDAKPKRGRKPNAVRDN